MPLNGVASGSFFSPQDRRSGVGRTKCRKWGLIFARVTKHERRMIEQAARASGAKSLSGYLRGLAVGAAIATLAETARKVGTDGDVV